MKQGNGRIKGNSFETLISKMIVKAGEHFGFTRKDCYRTPRSGGHAFAKKQNPSDLVLSKRLRKIFPVSVECKHHKRVDFQWFWTKKGPVFKWIDQARREAGKWHPIVVFRWNYSKIFCIHPIYCDSCRNSVPCVLTVNRTKIRFKYRNEIYEVALFSSFLKLNLKKG